MTTQEGPWPSRGFYNPNTERPRYYSGYRWNSLTNEINDVFPNATSGMQYQKVGASQAAWSSDHYGVNGNFCTQPQMCPASTSAQNRQCEERHVAHIKGVEYDVRPGAIFSTANTSAQVNRSEPFPVSSMQQCATLASQYSRPAMATRYSGSNAWTFWPDYTSSNALTSNKGTPGMCVIGHVREPFYQTLTPHDNGAISGFSLTSQSRENHRFLFG